MSEFVTVPEILLSRADRTDKVLFFYDRFKQTHALSFRELIAGSLRVASLLGSTDPQDSQNHVLISLSTCPEFVFAFFGSLIAGHVPVPMVTDELLGPGEYAKTLSKLMKATSARFVIAREESLKACSGLLDTARGIASSEIAQAPLLQAPSDLRIDSDAPCFVQFSSGSTEDPKGVVISHRNVLANLGQLYSGMAISEKDSLCSWLPLYHDMGLIGGLLSPLYVGRPNHVMNPVDFVVSPAEWLSLVAQVKATILIAPDFAYRMCSRRIPEEQRASFDLSNVRLALSGAEPISARTIRAFCEAFRKAGFQEKAIFPVYGLAEATLAVTFRPLEGSFRTEQVGAEALAEGEARVSSDRSRTIELVSCGKPLAEVRLKIADAEGKELPERRVGRILIQSPAMTSGYLGNPEATRELFEQGWLRTGDLGYLADGELYVCGREKDLIILNGRNHHPTDLERKVAEVQGFRMGRSAATSFYDHDAGRELLQVVVECSELRPWRRKELRERIARSVSELVPVGTQAIRLVPPCTLARTSSGKVKRYELRIRLQDKTVDLVEKRFFVHFALSKFGFYSTAMRVWVRGLREKTRARGWLRKEDTIERQLEAYLISHLARVVEIGNKRIRSNVPFAEYHLDSLAAFNLCTQLEADIVPVPLPELIGLRDINALKAYLLKNHEAEVRAWRERDGTS